MLPKVADVTAIDGKHVVGLVSSWQAPKDRTSLNIYREKTRMATCRSFTGCLNRTEMWLNLTQKTGQKLTGPVTNWVINNVEHLAGQGPNNSLFVFSWTPSTNWLVVNVSKITREKVDGVPTVYQLSDGKENVELLGVKNLDEPIKF